LFGKRKPEEPKLPVDASPWPPLAGDDTPAPLPEVIPEPIPAQPVYKESPMARSPFAPPLPAAPITPSIRPSGNNLPPVREAGERRTLVVGRGISVQGTVQDAERLVVEGTVEASMIHATELSVSPGGVFKGEVEVEDAEIAGTIDGTLTARGSLVVRGSGKVLGTARCRRLQVEDGGQITGRIEMISDQPQSDLPPRPQNVESAI